MPLRRHQQRDENFLLLRPVGPLVQVLRADGTTTCFGPAQAALHIAQESLVF